MVPLRSLLAGKSGVGLIDRFDASEFPTKFAAQIRNFSSEGCAGWQARLTGVLMV